MRFDDDDAFLRGDEAADILIPLTTMVPEGVTGTYLPSRTTVRIALTSEMLFLTPAVDS
jgi:hypothetical protein